MGLNNQVIAPGMTRLLGTLRTANMNSTADQAIPIAAGIAKFSITGIVIANASISLTTAAGGFYPTTAKGGTAIVAAAQVYSSLTAATILLNATLTAGNNTTPYTIGTVYLSLTTAQGVAATADVYVFGQDLT